MRPRRPETPPHAAPQAAPSPRPDIEGTTPAEGSLRPPTSAQVTRLVVVYPRTQAGVHLLGDAEAVLGRHSGPAIPVAVMHPTVSRRHAIFRWDPAARRHTVADLGSRNGTWLNGQTLSALPRYLEDQAVLRIGSVIAIYERLDAAAIGGTLFLDELGELPLDLQPKLLRAVELGEVVAVGSTHTHRVDVPLVAATNRSLFADVEQGKFRRDLYARLALREITVPPLRARRADMLAWIDRLHAAWAAQRERSDLAPLEFQPDAAEALLLQPWLDNLRGLQRFVHACAAIADPVPIHRAELGPWLAGGLPLETSMLAGTPVPASLRNNRPRPTREALLAILKSTGWSIRATAKHYERDRKQISRWIEMYTIEMPTRGSE